MTKTERMIHLIRLMRTGESFNIDELAETCKVSRRTIYRDMVSLSELDFELESCNGYSLAESTPLDQCKLSTLDNEVLILSLKLSPLNRSKYLNSIIIGIESKLINLQIGNKPKPEFFLSGRVHGMRPLSPGNDKNLQKFIHAVLTGRKVIIETKGSEIPPDGLVAQKLVVKNDWWLLQFKVKGRSKLYSIKLKNVKNIIIRSK